jgi:hypothetical protein
MQNRKLIILAVILMVVLLVTQIILISSVKKGVNDIQGNLANSPEWLQNLLNI